MTTTDMMSKQQQMDSASPLLVFSSDNHVGPRMSDLRPYCPEKYLAAFDEFSASDYADPVRNRVINEPAYSKAYANARNNNLQTAGHYDGAAFFRDMDREGIAAAAIFHQSLNGEPFPFDITNSFGQGIPTAEARELAGVGRAMYNRWLLDFCSVEPERSVALAQLPFWDIDLAIKELEWCAENRMRGVNFPAPGAPGMAQPDDPEFEPFFDAAAALDMTLTTHIGSGPPLPEGRSPRSLEHGLKGMSFGLVDSLAWGLRTAYMLCMYGVFERHPNLKLVITEIPGVSWNTMARNMDSVHFTPVRNENVDVLPKPPSEYMATNVWMGSSFQSRQEALDAIDAGREDRFMWGSDYPHPEGTFCYSADPDQIPMTRLSLAFTYHDLPVDKVRKLVGENALRAYPRLDEGALRKVAEHLDVGVDEIAEAPDLAKHSYVNETGTLGFRTYGAWS
jgi:predicted TIM-barrel fold metal-dependent hydrolase